MKLSFSFTKPVIPKRVNPVQIQPDNDQLERREVVAISVDEGIVVSKTEQDIEAERMKTIIIPCKTLYTPREKRINEVESSSNDFKAQRSVGLVLNPSYSAASAGDETVQEKKGKSSILMQIMEARRRGEVQDAPTEAIRGLDANEFGWALLRGMGYDESKETIADTKAIQTIVGNRTKLGIGVKLESLPSSKK